MRLLRPHNATIKHDFVTSLLCTINCWNHGITTLSLSKAVSTSKAWLMKMGKKENTSREYSPNLAITQSYNKHLNATSLISWKKGLMRTRMSMILSGQISSKEIELTGRSMSNRWECFTSLCWVTCWMRQNSNMIMILRTPISLQTSQPYSRNVL